MGTRCPDCGQEKSRYEVKIGTKLREYWTCWPCYDEYKKRRK